MADDNAPVAAPVVPAAVIPPPAPVAGDPPAAVVPPPAPVEPPPTNIPQPIFDRIDRLTADKKTAQEEVARLTAELAARPAAPAVAPVVPPALAPAPVAPVMDAAAVQAAARTLVAEQNFVTKCNGISAAGVAAHPDFTAQVRQLDVLGYVDPTLIEAAAEVGDAHEILYALSKDLPEAAKIAALGPASKAIALVKFNEKRRAAAAALVSNAPVPPDTRVDTPAPLNNDIPSPKDKSEDWFRKREAQLARKA